MRARLAVGKKLKEGGHYTQALVHFKELQRMMPNQWELHFEIADTLMRKGDRRSALSRVPEGPRPGSQEQTGQKGHFGHSDCVHEAVSPYTADEEFVVDEKPVPIFLSREEGKEDLCEAHQQGHARKRAAAGPDTTQLAESVPSNPLNWRSLFETLLPTLDGFDRVLSAARGYEGSEEIDNWLKSIESLYFRMLRMLESYGLFQIQAVGKKVDLNMHEVVEYRSSANYGNDIVISERQKGYVFRGRLLRDAKVVVAHNERR